MIADEKENIFSMIPEIAVRNFTNLSFLAPNLEFYRLLKFRFQHVWKSYFCIFHIRKSISYIRKLSSTNKEHDASDAETESGIFLQATQ